MPQHNGDIQLHQWHKPWVAKNAWSILIACYEKHLVHRCYYVEIMLLEADQAALTSIYADEHVTSWYCEALHIVNNYILHQ